MVIFGWMRRGILLGAKLEECERCGPTAHYLIRQIHWFSLFWIPVLPLWLSHKLVCSECRAEIPISFGDARAALRSGSLPLDRERPGFERWKREQMGSGPDDWKTLGLAPGASPEEIHARFRELAKSAHPDVGGSSQAFAALSGAYRRVLASPKVDPAAAVEPGDVFDPFIPNPHPGAWNTYLHAWPFLAGVALVVVLAGGALSPSPAYPSAPAYQPPAVPAFAPAGDEHICYLAADGNLAGCRGSNGAVLFGNTGTGQTVTCWFTEPVPTNQTTFSCSR